MRKLNYYNRRIYYLYFIVLNIYIYIKIRELYIYIY